MMSLKTSDAHKNKRIKEKDIIFVKVITVFERISSEMFGKVLLMRLLRGVTRYCTKYTDKE